VRKDEYNDSSRGPGTTEEIYCRLSYLETERFLEKYNLNDHCNYIANKLKPNKYLFGRVEVQTVFHEFGHIFAYYIFKKMGFDFGEIKEVALKNKTTQVKLSRDVFKYLQDITSLPKYEFLKHRKANIDKRSFLCYALFVLSGAVFNVFYFKKQPDYWEFREVFTNDTEKEKYGTFIARAGDDFSKLCNHRIDLDWDYYNFENFKYMAYEFFYILDKHGVFYDLSIREEYNEYDFLEMPKSEKKPYHSSNFVSLLDVFEKKFNGKITTDTQRINKIIDCIDSSINYIRKEMLMIDINLLIDKYIIDITYCKKDTYST
jgi:hypothetical protein